ncbi:putative transporter [Desulfotalea psychrophila]|uniref:Related to SbmA protein n=1 Tax=Desulfotalea psychrophila (strain LSv54 / DSM 12343) TaxID=177439 RepID=Q6AIY8_DESPS|nr:putative transporter [Desulfotalea psychrophila]CAG37692.1 related to SbmA protein [Desulfotalea psychrophila LSv54]
MFKSFFMDKKWALWAYGGAIFLLLALFVQVELTVKINQWYGAFYDLLQKAEEHTVDEFWASMKHFSFIAFPYVLIATLTSYFTRIYSFKWREAMTFSYISKWQTVEEEVEGSSQRIQEDIYRFARIFESLGLQVTRAIMTLFAFLPILWGLSSGVDLPYLRDIPGSLVWVALVVSLGGLVISWFVGIKLPGLEYNNQKIEAAFRKELVYAEDDKVNYGKTCTLVELFVGLKFNYNRLFLHYGYFDIWVNFFEQLMIITPYLIMATGLFTGLITLGVLVQVSNAFSKVRESFSIFIANWTTITELRSIHKRLREFEHNIGY